MQVKAGLFFIFAFCWITNLIMAQEMKELTPEEERVIVYKGTERPFTGAYYDFHEEGVYVCKRCGNPLFRSEDKFDSGCGWPSFDEEIPGSVKRILDSDGIRTEIVCANCGAHLGHVFEGERFTPKNTRHCVNSISLDFVAEAEAEGTVVPQGEEDQTAIFAGGCFWGVEHLLKQVPGVLSVESGYIGGDVPNPTYEQVSTGKTGHAEAVRILFDPEKVSYETPAKMFFEIHDPEQANGQGPDLGPQYRSEIFYTTPQQEEIARKLIEQLKAKGYQVVTKVTPASTFWKAEDYHQNYYTKTGKQPYCHRYTKRF